VSATSNGGAPEILTPEWPLPAGVRAAFTLRPGGASEDPYSALNTAAHVGDLPEAVTENRRRLRAALDLPDEPAWLNQVHGTTVGDLDAGAPPAQADAALARSAGRVCVVQVADCLPVLFAAKDAMAVAAAHAGWRGLAGGVLEETVRALGIPPPSLTAWLGPAISAANFEVGDEVRAAFVGRDSRAQVAFTPNHRGRWQCDLAAPARQRLASLGISAVYAAGQCTFADPERFYSYRRDGRTGRHAALIWLT
jgi:polyphenol oxidase